MATAAGKPTTSSQELLQELAARALEETTQREKLRAERAAAADAAVSAARARAAIIGLIVAIPVLIAVIAWDVTAAPASVVPDTPQEALKFVVREIEGYREDYSKLPDTLIEAGPFRDSEFTYTKKSADQYQVAVRKHGQTLTYDSQRPEPHHD